MSEENTHRIIELIDLMLDSIEVIQTRTSAIRTANDFLMSPDNIGRGLHETHILRRKCQNHR